MTQANTNPQSGAMADFISQIAARFAERGTHLFADLADGPLSYAACKQDMDDYARLFATLGLSKGHRGLIISGYDRSTITLFLAMLAAGIVPVIADPASTPPERLELIDLCKAHALFCDTGPQLDALATDLSPSLRVIGLNENGRAADAIVRGAEYPILQTASADAAQDIALLVLTSGTTSQPKAVALSHANLTAQLDIFQRVYGFDADTRLLNVLPLHHVDGLIRGPLAALWVGGSLHRGKPFSVQSAPEMLAKVADQGMTHLITVPAMLRIIDRVGRDTPDIFKTPVFRFVICSADLLEPALWQRVETTFGVRVVNAYGLSEVVCDALFASPQDSARRIGTLGRPVGCTARVVDSDGRNVPTGETGELVLSGPTVMAGYFGAADTTAAVLKDGAFHTGDFVRADVDGIYEFIGRKKTAIVSAGFTIHPETATQVLSAMPGVHEAVAFGIADTAIGERLVAAIVPAPGQSLTAADAAAYCRTKLAPERCPREFRIVDALPRGASGKVILSDLTQLMQNQPEPSPRADVLQVAAKCFNVSVETLSLASNPFNTDGWDSMAHMALIDALEAAFAMQFTAMQIAQIMSLGDAQRFIGEALAVSGKAT